MPELEELQNAKERLIALYSQLHTLVLRIVGAQPIVSAAMLVLLDKAMKQARVAADVSQANVQHVNRNWNLL